MSKRPNLKIAFITSFPLDLTTGSGVVRMILGYSQALKTLGHRVTLLHPRFKATSYLNLAVQRLTFNKTLKFAPQDFDLIVGSDFDGFVLDHLNQPKFVLNAGILADIVQFEKGQTARILAHLAQREAQNVRSASRVVVPSNYTVQKIVDYYHVPRERISVIPLGIDHAYWQDLAEHCQPQFRNGIRILSVARQYPRKGIADLLRAFYHVAQSQPQTRLIIVGGGPELPANKTLAQQLGLESRVTFVGDLADQQQLASYYAQADIFCLPSYHETFGLVFLEAMFFKLPVVTYASTAIPEVVGEECGFLCPAGNIACLTEKLLTLVQAPHLRKKMGQQGHLRSMRFSWLASAKKLIALLPEIQ